MNIINWIKNNVSSFIYIICGVITLSLTIGLFTWSMQGELVQDVNIISKNVVFEENAQLEYLLNQNINTEDVYLNIGDDNNPKLVSASECEIDADLKTAGNKKITLTYAIDKYNAYQGSFNVNVLFVRNLFVKNMPSSVSVNEKDNTFTSDDSFEIYAELSMIPKTNYFNMTTENGINYVRLSNNMYTTSVSESSNIDGYYYANLYCGNLSYKFNFYNNANRTFFVHSEKDIVFYENNNSSSNDKLILVVDDRDSIYQTESVGKTNGHYIYEKNDTKSVYNFSFELTENDEIFNSEINDYKDSTENKYIVNIESNIFKVQANLFQSAVVNGLIYDDGGYKLVSESDSRILSLNYIGDKTGDIPTLTLYITSYYFDTSTGNGLSVGFYIYEYKDIVLKAKFNLQTFVWTHVPLSVTKADPESDIYVGDWLQDTNYEDNVMDNYIGDLYTSFKYFKRGEGWTEDLFTSDFNTWRMCAYNMA